MLGERVRRKSVQNLRAVRIGNARGATRGAEEDSGVNLAARMVMARTERIRRRDLERPALRDAIFSFGTPGRNGKNLVQQQKTAVAAGKCTWMDSEIYLTASRIRHWRKADVKADNNLQTVVQGKAEYAPT